MRRPTRHALIQGRLAARVAIAKAEAIDQAEAAGQAVARDVAGLWRQLWAVVRAHRNAPALYHRIRAVLAQLVPLLYSSIDDRLRRLAAWRHKTSAWNVVNTLPWSYLAAS